MHIRFGCLATTMARYPQINIKFMFNLSKRYCNVKFNLIEPILSNENYQQACSHANFAKKVTNPVQSLNNERIYVRVLANNRIAARAVRCSNY